MPLEKQPSTEGCERMGLRTLLLCAFLLCTALIFAAIGATLLTDEGASVISDVMENEAIHAFLGIDSGV